MDEKYIIRLSQPTRAVLTKRSAAQRGLVNLPMKIKLESTILFIIPAECKMKGEPALFMYAHVYPFRTYRLNYPLDALPRPDM